MFTKFHHFIKYQTSLLLIFHLIKIGKLKSINFIFRQNIFQKLNFFEYSDIPSQYCYLCPIMLYKKELTLYIHTLPSMNSKEKKPFKIEYSLERRKQMVEEAKLKSKGNIVVIVEKDIKCKAFPDLHHCRFSIAGDQKIMDVYNAIRKRIIAIDPKYESQPFFLFTNRVLTNREMSIKQLYQSHKDSDDGLLYFKYSNMDPY